LPLERAPEVFLGVVASRRVRRVEEVPVPDGVHSRGSEYASEIQARQVRERAHPRRLAADLDGGIPVGCFALETVRAAEREERPDPERQLGGAAVDVAD